MIEVSAIFILLVHLIYNIHKMETSSCGGMYIYMEYFAQCGGVCGQVVNTLNSESGGPGFKPGPLRCFLRQGTLLHFVSLHPVV